VADQDLQPNRAVQPLPISIGTIFDAVKTIVSSGHEAEFLAQCNQRGFSIVVDQEIINFVKEFLLNNDAHKGNEAWNTIAREVIISPQGRCP
jgi:hypothetical protein